MFNKLPHTLYTVQQVRELDRIAIEDEGLSGLSLMQRAGEFAFKSLRDNWPQAKRLVVVCGLGNNAGDGYVIARLAHTHGFELNAVQVGNIETLKGDAKSCYEELVVTGVELQNIEEVDCDAADIIVDALLGTGLDREVTGAFADAITIINSSTLPKLSVDVPSGLNADTGMPMGLSVKAQLTVTFIGMKQGLLTAEGRDYVGKVVFSDLSVPASVYRRLGTSNSQHINFQSLRATIRKRTASAHKGSHGRVLIIGGNTGFSGAARLAGEAALRSGAGLVTVATQTQYAQTLNIGRPELMVRGVENYQDLGAMMQSASVIAIGPGLGQDQWAMALFSRVLESSKPQVLDADALNLLARQPYKNTNRILTPHPGEAARLLNISTAEVQADRFQAIRNLQQQYGGVIVLKGSGTLVIDSNSTISICSDGNPGMATGGMGDVLTGVIAALLAQGFDIDTAAKLGVCLHSAAADTAAGAGEIGLLASDLMPYLRTLINQ